MIKLTVLYGHPADPAAFEDYYANTHTPIALKMTGLSRVEVTKFLSAPDGGQPAHYRMAEFWFETPEAMQATMSSPEGQAAAADIPNFATGGATFIIGEVENNNF
jgi:uncharacterized protein (TIGR02118 family)